MTIFRAAFLFAAAFFVAQAGAAPAEQSKSIPLPGGYDTLVVPSNSPVRFASFAKYDAAKFAGRFVLSGTYLFGNSNVDGSSERYLELRFTPDPVDAAKLPHRKNYGRIDNVSFTNADDFIKAAIPKDKLAALRNGHIAYLTGKIAIWADAYSIDVECDTQYAYARFISIYKPAPVLAARRMPDSGC